MNSEMIGEWMSPLSKAERVKALTHLYSNLTVVVRQLFLPDIPKGKEEIILNMLHGMNELHHTVANQLLTYAYDEEQVLPLEGLGQQLLEIANYYKIKGLLDSAIALARTIFEAKPPIKKGDH
jgi:hypothetical protein